MSSNILEEAVMEAALLFILVEVTWATIYWGRQSQSSPWWR
jgi:hypothetical protein